jgi:5-methyltetrahydropteroyltriglutamate--homocysteine methyltransferase
MQRSTDRILTTHVGSLARTRPVIEGMLARAAGEGFDEAGLGQAVADGVREVVQKQLETGIDIPSDGEYGKAGFNNYIEDCIAGLEPRELEPGETSRYDGPERRKFPDFFRQYDSFYRKIWMLPGISLNELDRRPRPSGRFRVTGPVGYKGHAFIQTQVRNLKAALSSRPDIEAFMPATTPVRHSDLGYLDFYASEAEYLYAMADALHEEYKAITDAGFVLQVDFAALHGYIYSVAEDPATATKAKVDAKNELWVDVVNHALQGIPEDRVRYHHCWGSMNDPHTTDVPLREIAGLMLKIKAQAYSIEAANPRHEHEWMVWKDVKLPDGKILIPGVISHQTNVVEHPELVAWRIENFASVVGKENLIAGVDCGFSQFWDSIRVHPTVQWAKLRSLVEGAELASEKLWQN